MEPTGFGHKACIFQKKENIVHKFCSTFHSKNWTNERKSLNTKIKTNLQPYVVDGCVSVPHKTIKTQHTEICAPFECNWMRAMIEQIRSWYLFLEMKKKIPPNGILWLINLPPHMFILNVIVVHFSIDPILLR